MYLKKAYFTKMFDYYDVNIIIHVLKLSGKDVQCIYILNDHKIYTLHTGTNVYTTSICVLLTNVHTRMQFTI